MTVLSTDCGPANRAEFPILETIRSWGAREIADSEVLFEKRLAEALLDALHDTKDVSSQKMLLVAVLREHNTAVLVRAGVGDDWAVPPELIQEIKESQDN